MKTTKYVLKQIAYITELDLSVTDIRESHSEIVRISTDKVDRLILVLNDQSLVSIEKLLRILLYSTSYRLKMPIKDMYTYHDFNYGELGFYLCPQCNTPIEFDFQKFCGSCGQALGWKNYKSVVIHRAPKKRLKED